MVGQLSRHLNYGISICRLWFNFSLGTCNGMVSFVLVYGDRYDERKYQIVLGAQLNHNIHMNTALKKSLKILRRIYIHALNAAVFIIN